MKKQEIPLSNKKEQTSDISGAAQVGMKGNWPGSFPE